MSIRIRKCMCSNTGSLVLHLIEFKVKSEGTEAEDTGNWEGTHRKITLFNI